MKELYDRMRAGSIYATVLVGVSQLFDLYLNGGGLCFCVRVKVNTAHPERILFYY